MAFFLYSIKILPQNIWFLSSPICVLPGPLQQFDKMVEETWKKLGRHVLKELERVGREKERGSKLISVCMKRYVRPLS